MNSSREAVLDAALRLPEADRAALVAELLSSLGPDPIDPTEDSWLAELEARSEDARRDASTTVSWSTLKAER